MATDTSERRCPRPPQPGRAGNRGFVPCAHSTTTSPRRTHIVGLAVAILLTTVLVSSLPAQLLENPTFSGLNLPVPDGNPAGMSFTTNLISGINSISSVKVRLNLAGEFNGDLFAYVRHSNQIVVLVNRPGRTATDSFGYDDAGLNVTFDDGASHDFHLYGLFTNVPDGAPLTGLWQPDGRLVDPDLVTDSSNRTSFLSAFRMMDANGPWTLYVADMQSGGTNALLSWGLELHGTGVATLTWPTPADITYGTVLGPTQLNASASVPGSFAYQPATATMLNAGSNQVLSVVFTPTDTNSYASMTNTVKINVLKAPLTITALNATKAYGAVLPVFGASYSGWVNGDSTNNLTAQAVLSTLATAASPVGGYPINASGAASANYTISYVSGTLTVTKAALTITAQSTSKAYGAALPGFGATYSGWVNGDTTNNLTAQAVLSTLATAASPVGSYPINASGAASANYTIAYVPGTLAVNPVTLTITVLSTNKVYGAALPGFGATYSGFVNGDTTNSLTLQVVLSTTATAASAAGSYPITATGAAAANYTIAYVPGILIISKAGLTGMVSSSKNPSLPGDAVSFTLTLNAVAPGAGTPTGSVQFKLDGTNTSSPVALSGGTASFSTSTLLHGTHTVAAEYTGDTNFTGTTNSLAPVQLVNTPPTAGAVTIERNPTESVKVKLASLLGFCADADADPLTLTVSPVSAGGATVRVSGGWVFYMAKAGLTTADSFTYTVSDGWGGTAAATVTVALKASPPETRNVSIQTLGNGTLKLVFSGIPGRTYTIQYTDDLVHPNWQTLGPATADTVGLYQYVDSQPLSQGMRLYRSAYIP